MKLYYTPGACSMSPHIVLREAGLPFELERVDLYAKKTETGADFTKINAKGLVPTLQLDNGELLTEGPAIVQYLADRNPQSGLVPPAGSMERYRQQEWLNYVTSELHKTFGPLFNDKMPEAVREMIKER
ncbi:MAG: glutathione S-transferase N-terminal domain-containing protein, partial [Pseudomonadota bacterium]